MRHLNIHGTQTKCADCEITGLLTNAWTRHDCIHVHNAIWKMFLERESSILECFVKITGLSANGIDACA